MKKLRLVIVAIVCLVATLVVSSFAWFSIGNNGILSTNVGTKNQLVIDFSNMGTNDESMMPAKLKKGVINHPSGTIGFDSEGEPISVPKGTDVLPAKDGDWKYITSNGQLTTTSEYLEVPATIVYSQFGLTLNLTPTQEEPTNKDVYFSFVVRYYNVDQVSDINEGLEKTPLHQLPIFGQIGALQFNFFLIETSGGLTEEELVTISTHTGEVSENRTIEEFIASRNNDNDESNDLTLHSKTGECSKPIRCEDVDSYRHTASPLKDQQGNDTSTYTVSFEDIEINQTYYILLESYYNVPDAMVEGNLPLKGQFVLDLTYDEAK